MYNLTVDETVFCVIDLETTGLNPQKDQVIEIAALKVEGGVITNKFHTLVKPSYDFIPPNITNLTGITNAMVIDKPKIEDIYPKFYDFLKGSVIVAHNAKSDISFISQIHRVTYNREFDIPYICTQNIAKALFPHLNSKSLSNLAYFLNVQQHKRHRAMDDAIVTYEIFKRMLDYLQDLNISKVIDLVKITNGKTLVHANKRRRYV